MFLHKYTFQPQTPFRPREDQEGQRIKGDHIFVFPKLPFGNIDFKLVIKAGEERGQLRKNL